MRGYSWNVNIVVEVGVGRFQINDENHKISQVLSCAIFKTWRT